MMTSPLIARDLLPSLYNGIGRFDTINDFPILIANIIQIIIFLVAISAVIFIIWSGILLITSAGEPAKTAAGKNGIRNAILGIILASGSYMLVDFMARQFPG